MKILLVVWNFYPNTAYTNHTKATVHGFRESGVECDVLSIKPLIEADDMALNHMFTGTRTFFKTGFAMFYNYINLAKFSQKYDVIYCALSDIRVIRRLLAIAKKKKKVIVHERTEYPDVFMPVDSSKMKKYCHLVAKFDKLFTISSFIQKFFIERGVDKEKIQIYPMIVDPNRFMGVEKLNVGYRYIAYCGNLQNTKDGVADLIEAYGKSIHTKQMFKLVLIGKKPSEEELGIYKDMIAKYDSKDRVIFTGQVQYYDMPQMLKNADILALCRPANHQAEGGFPTKLGEYLSTANPVLVTNVGDMELYIKDGINGYVSEADNVIKFKEKLEYISTHYDEAKLVGERGKKLVYSSFNNIIQTAKVLDTLKGLIK